MSRNTARLRRVAMVATLSLILCAALVVLSRDSRHLLRVASPVASVRDWAVPDPAMHNLLPYFWLPDNSMLFFRHSLSGGYLAYRQPITVDGHAGPAVMLPMMEIAADERIQSLSPDGKWLYVTHWFGPGNILPIAFAVDGSRTVSWSSQYSVAMQWSRSGAELMRLQGGQNGWNLDEFRLDGTVRNRGPVVNYGSHGSLALLGVTGDGQVIAANGGGTYVKPQTSLQLVTFDLDHPKQPQRIYKLKGPDGSVTAGVTLSPDGRRLLWTCTSDLTPAFVVWMSRLFHKPYRIEFKHSWWVSQLDGSRMHEIGHISQREDDGGIGLRWMSDSKRCSFVYRGRLYVVPTD